MNDHDLDAILGRHSKLWNYGKKKTRRLLLERSRKRQTEAVIAELQAVADTVYAKHGHWELGEEPGDDTLDAVRSDVMYDYLLERVEELKKQP